jgi:hypothetical protein
VNACQSGQLDSGVDLQLGEDMAQVAADGVVGDEKAFSHLAISRHNA